MPYIEKKDDKIIGTFTVCHKLDKGLYLYGGHIAGSTCPSERKKDMQNFLYNLL